MSDRLRQPMSGSSRGPSSPTVPRPFSHLFSEPSLSPIEIKNPSLHNGQSTIFFTQEDINKVAAPFRLALVGKFNHGCPKIEEIQRFFLSIGLKQNGSVGLLDSRHVLVRFMAEQDFHQIWTRGIWNIGKFPMQTF